MCGTNNTQHNSVEDIVDGIVEIALSLKRIYHPIATFVYGLLPHDSNWSINRVYIDEINNYLYSKSKLNGINFINHTDWTFQDGSLKPNLFYANKLHLILEGNGKLAASIYNSINPNASNIDEIVSVSSKLFACDTGLNLKQEDFSMLPCNVPVCHSVSNPDNPTVQCVRKSIYKFVSTSSVLSGKPIRDSNVHSSNLVNTSSICSSKPIHGSNFRLSKPITCSIACRSKLVSGNNVRYIKPVSVGKLVVVMFVQVKPLVLLMFMQVNRYMVVMFVQENLLVLVMFVQVKLLVLVMLLQVIPVVLSMFIQQNLLVLVIFVQVNLFVETMFVQVNLFVEAMFVKVNPLMLISFHVNLFSLTIPIMLIHQY